MMKKKILTLNLLLWSLFACKEADKLDPIDANPGNIEAQGVLDKEGNLVIDKDMTWKAKDNDVTAKPSAEIVLTKHTFIKNSTLTIEAGSVIKGEEGSSLVITPTGKLIVKGTKENPVVFTSSKNPGSRKAGDWGLSPYVL